MYSWCVGVHPPECENQRCTQQGNFLYHSPTFETKPLTEPGACQFGCSGRPTSTKVPLVATHLTLWSQTHAVTPSIFYMGPGNVITDLRICAPSSLPFESCHHQPQGLLLFLDRVSCGLGWPPAYQVDEGGLGQITLHYCSSCGYCPRAKTI